MRLELAGSLVRPDPVVLKFTSDQDIISDLLDYIELGYTHFDVICIGAGGGSGGGINTGGAGTLIRSYGGAGGGGGFHRVRGLLSALAENELCQVIVGAAGIPGTDHASNPALTTDGGDGEASTFNNTTCRASGGKGGKRVQSNSTSTTTQAHGGEGGLGNRTAAGGGAAGGMAGIPSPSGPGTPGTPGTDGSLFSNNVGEGGGGGAGGVGQYVGLTNNPATAGGRGSYNPGDTSVYGPGGTPQFDENAGAINTVPGGASGAKAAPLNGLPTVYGQSSEMGVVILRLTTE